MQPVLKRAMSHFMGNERMAQDDPEMWELVKEEKMRQMKGIELIASEVSTFFH